MGTIVRAIMGYYTIWQELDNIDPAMLKVMKNTVTYLENGIMASEALVDMEGNPTDTDMDMENPIGKDKISPAIQAQLAEMLKDKDILRTEMADHIIDARQNVKKVVREECQAILTEMDRIVRFEGAGWDSHAAHVKRTLKRIHDLLLADNMSVDGTEKSRSSCEEGEAKRRKDSRGSVKELPIWADIIVQAKGMVLDHALKNNMTELMEHKIIDWLLGNPDHMLSTTRNFEPNFMD